MEARPNTKEFLDERAERLRKIRRSNIKKYCALTQREKLRQAFLQMTLDMQPTAWFNFTTNSQCSADELRSKLKKFCARLDRKRLGKFYYQQLAEKRCNGILTIEKVEINTHAHGAICLPLDEIKNIIEPSKSIWETICPSGDLKIMLMNDRATRANYMGKEQKYLRNYDFGQQIVLLSEFHSQR